MKTLLLVALAAFARCLAAQTQSAVATQPLMQDWLCEQEQQLELFFGVDADLDWYDDSDGMNAVAIPGKSQILVGSRLVRYHLLKAGRGVRSLQAILAHEYGHLAQEHYPNSLSFAYRELHADLLAGYYLGRNGLVDASGFWVYANATFEIGDYDAGSFSHHGTPTERLACLMAGFRLAHLPLEEAFRVGEEFVENNF
mgnify:CR=1 FL=1